MINEEGEGLRSSDSWYERNEAIFKRNKGQGSRVPGVRERAGTVGKSKSKEKQDLAKEGREETKSLSHKNHSQLTCI